MVVGFFGGRILGIFRPFSVTNEQPEISALFPGKRADFSFSAWAEGGGRRPDFTEGRNLGPAEIVCVRKDVVLIFLGGENLSSRANFWEARTYLLVLIFGRLELIFLC